MQEWENRKWCRGPVADGLKGRLAKIDFFLVMVQNFLITYKNEYIKQFKLVPPQAPVTVNVCFSSDTSAIMIKWRIMHKLLKQ